MKFRYGALFVSLTLGCVFLLCGAVPSHAQELRPGVKTVMIDPGHGGKDPGTVYGKIFEKDINLSVALKLGKMITDNLPDVKVHYTRTTDVFMSLDKRSQMANKVNADLFISIHVNAVDPGKTAPSGALTLVMGLDHANANLDVAMRENDVIMYEDDYTTKYEGYTPGSAESFIIFNLMQYAYIDQSMTFANIIQNHYKKSTPMPDRGARQQKLLVLRTIAMPGVLTELGFITNETDRKFLNTEAGKTTMATALFNAFSEYKAKVEGKTSSVQLPTAHSTTASTQQASSAGTNSRPASNAVSAGKIVYRIQVCTSAQKLGMNGTVLKKYKELGVTEKVVDGMYKYYVGNCTTYQQASELQKTVRKTTADAFMVAFEDEAQISVSEARKKTK